jgi:hypothetical protein
MRFLLMLLQPLAVRRRLRGLGVLAEHRFEAPLIDLRFRQVVDDLLFGGAQLSHRSSSSSCPAALISFHSGGQIDRRGHLFVRYPFTK